MASNRDHDVVRSLHEGQRVAALWRIKAEAEHWRGVQSPAEVLGPQREVTWRMTRTGARCVACERYIGGSEGYRYGINAQPPGVTEGSGSRWFSLCLPCLEAANIAFARDLRRAERERQERRRELDAQRGPFPWEDGDGK